MARSDVASHAIAANETALAIELLSEAEALARADTDGYFAAGALRDVAKGWAQLGERDKAAVIFADAVTLTDRAHAAQKKARAISRIATAMADVNMAEQGQAYFPQSIAANREEPSGVMRRYSYYEITGSAAFTGDFATASDLIDEVPDEPFGSAGSLRDATLRDIAWGQARFGQFDRALATAKAISSPRERVQALSRIVRLLRSPDMHALARYL